MATLVNPATDDDQHKNNQLPEPSVVGAIALAVRADAWAPLVSTLKVFATALFKDYGLAPGESALDRVQQAIESILPPHPTHGHEKKKKAGQRHGAPNPITDTAPVVGKLGTHLTHELEQLAVRLQTEQKSAVSDLRQAAIKSQLEALEDAVSSAALHRLCARLLGIIETNRFKANDNAMNRALLGAKSFSVDSTDKEHNRDAGKMLTGMEMAKLTPDQPDQILQARHLRDKVLACCGDDAFLQSLVKYKFDNSFGRNKRALTVDEIASAPDGPFAQKALLSLTMAERKAKIYKANEKLVTIKQRLKKEGEWPNR